LEIQENVRRVSTRPLVLLVALLSAVALSWVAWYALSTRAAAPVVNSTPFHFVSERPGPDAASRNRPTPSESPDPWAGHGQ
jgi:hypothetical protein